MKENPQISQINADEGEKDFLWKARMNRMIRMVGWKLLNMERGDRQEEIGMRKGVFLWKGRMNPFGWMNRMNRMVGWKQLNVERGKRKEETE